MFCKENTAIQENMLTDTSFDDLSRLVKTLAGKIDKLDADNKGRHDVLFAKLTQLETTMANLSGELNELKQGLKFTNQEVETVKDILSNKVDSACVDI